MSSKYTSDSEGATRHRRTVCWAAQGEHSDDNVNPYTGNPQTGKLIDEYLWMGPLLAVIILGFVSLYNAQDVLRQTSRADQTRAPADKAEWLAMDNSNIYGPCGRAQGGDDALEDLLEGRPCPPETYNRAPPNTQMPTPRMSF